MERKELLMTDDEFDVLDELYFVLPYKDLLASVELSDVKLRVVLESLRKKQWIKVLNSVDRETPEEEIRIIEKAQTYYFLITKSGLLSHNSN